jgi:large subunit ribosomal protein L14
MIQPRTMLKVIDNSGAKIVQCFHVVGSTGIRYAEIGDLIQASVKIAEPRQTVKKKDKVKAIVVRQRKPFKRDDGTFISFDENAVILVNDKMEPLGGRLFGPIPRELKERGYTKVVALAKEII